MFNSVCDLFKLGFNLLPVWPHVSSFSLTVANIVFSAKVCEDACGVRHVAGPVQWHARSVTARFREIWNDEYYIGVLTAFSGTVCEDLDQDKIKLMILASKRV